ncbi:hypothetical protein ACTXT7_008975 [Hymenolepis weldensis]
MSHYASASKSYEGDYGGDDDDMEDDDGYDLSDYDVDIDGGSAVASGEGPSTSADRRSESYSSRSSHHQGSKASASRHRTEFRRFRDASERLPDHSDDNRMFSCRRDHHNHLERKRRASIKGSYCDLREAIPSLRGSKASRAVTLQRAAEYIESLKKSNHEHSVCVDELNRQNEILERQVQDLYRNYQRLENNEYALTQAVAAAGGSSNDQSSPFSAPAPPSSLPVVTSSPGTSSTGNSTPTTAPLASNGSSSGGSNSLSSGFTVPVRLLSQHNQASNSSSTSSPDDPPPIPSSGLAQLSYAAMQLQQQQQSTGSPTTTKSSVVTTATTSPMPRLITLDPSSTGGTRNGVIPQHIRLSNSLSTTSGGRPIVVVSSATTSTSATLSALDTAVIKARSAPRPTGQDNQQQGVVGINVEVVSSSNTAATTRIGTQPRRVVIVSAQHHQELPAATTSKPSPSN